jgi:hypothetical protein
VSHVRGEILQHRLVLRAQWPHSKCHPVAQPFDGFQFLRIGRDRQPCRTRTLNGRDAQAGIEGDDAMRVGEQRVDVELTDLGAIGGELAKPDQHFDDSLDFRRWLAAVPLQELPHPCARHQPARQQRIERRQLERSIMHDLDGSASLAERHDWAEHRVFCDPGKKLYGPGARDHGLEKKAGEASAGARRLDALYHGAGFLPDAVGIAEIERNPADIAFVRDFAGADLQGNRKADRSSDRGSLIRILGQVIGDERKAVGRKDRSGFWRLQPGFSGRQSGCDDVPCRCEIGLE